MEIQGSSILCGVFRSIKLKNSFSHEKTSAVKSETQFSREAIKNYCCEVLKENYIIGRSWSSARLFIMQNYKTTYTDNTNGDVPLTAENV